MPVLSVAYGRDQNRAIDLTPIFLERFVKNNILHLPSDVDLNTLKGDPYWRKGKKLYITYSHKGQSYMKTYDENRFYDVTINTNEEGNGIHPDNIIIYPHEAYAEDNGGINVLYNFARVLNEMNKNACIYPSHGYIKNGVCNKYFVQNFDLNNAVVVYCEGTIGNPLNSRFVVRWLLSEIGKNVNIDRALSFGKNELVYYFNYETKFDLHPEHVNTRYKTLSMLYINPIFTNNNKSPRPEEWCFTKRKQSYHTYTNDIHPAGSHEIVRNTPFETHRDVFNKYKYFVSYDPLTFLTILAAKCGCISIVYPLNGMKKAEWYKTTAIHEYLSANNITELYGIAYGVEEIAWAESTLPLVSKQWADIHRYYVQNHGLRFLHDLQHFHTVENTIENNFYDIQPIPYDPDTKYHLSLTSYSHRYGGPYDKLMLYHDHTYYRIVDNKDSMEHYLNRMKNEIKKIITNVFYHDKITPPDLCEVPNKKFKIVIYTLPLDIKYGGILVMHNLAKMINDLNHPDIMAKLFTINGVRYENMFCNYFASLDDITDNTLVIYPEAIKGNPLGAKNIMRWILLELGIEFSINHSLQWNPSDLVYKWEPTENPDIYYRQLHCPWRNPIFYNKNNRSQEKTCYCYKKARLLPYKVNFFHPYNSICIDSLSLEEIAIIFNECKYFYCYDPNCFYVTCALLCGCIPVLYPFEGYTKESFFKSRSYNLNGKVYNKGIAWGNESGELQKAADELEDGIREQSEMDSVYTDSVRNFLQDVSTVFETGSSTFINNVENIYHSKITHNLSHK
jgi:hypothetical protein